MPTERRREVPPQLVANAWKPGQSGNPKGRPKVPTFEMLVAKILSEKVKSTNAEGKKISSTKRELVARVFVDELMKRNAGLLREFLARAWPAVQKHEHALTESAEADEVVAQLAQFARAKRANGDGREADAPGPNGSDGDPA